MSFYFTLSYCIYEQFCFPEYLDMLDSKNKIQNCKI